MRPLCTCGHRPAAINYKKGNKTYKYTLDLKKKIIEVYIIEEKKILTYHKCESNKI